MHQDRDEEDEPDRDECGARSDLVGASAPWAPIFGTYIRGVWRGIAGTRMSCGARHVTVQFVVNCTPEVRHFLLRLYENERSGPLRENLLPSPP